MQPQDISLCQRPHFATANVKRLTFSTPNIKATGAEALANNIAVILNSLMNWRLIKEKNTGTERTHSGTRSHFSLPAVFTDKPALEYEVRKHCSRHVLPHIR